MQNLVGLSSSRQTPSCPLQDLGSRGSVRPWPFSFFAIRTLSHSHALGQIEQLRGGGQRCRFLFAALAESIMVLCVARSSIMSRPYLSRGPDVWSGRTKDSRSLCPPSPQPSLSRAQRSHPRGETAAPGRFGVFTGLIRPPPVLHGGSANLKFNNAHKLGYCE